MNAREQVEPIFFLDGITPILQDSMLEGSYYSVTRKDGKLILLNPSRVAGNFVSIATYPPEAPRD